MNKYFYFIRFSWSDFVKNTKKKFYFNLRNGKKWVKMHTFIQGGKKLSLLYTGWPKMNRQFLKFTNKKMMAAIEVIPCRKIKCEVRTFLTMLPYFSSKYNRQRALNYLSVSKPCNFRPLTIFRQFNSLREWRVKNKWTFDSHFHGLVWVFWDSALSSIGNIQN